jgi:hypothetical protein
LFTQTGVIGDIFLAEEVRSHSDIAMPCHTTANPLTLAFAVVSINGPTFAPGYQFLLRSWPIARSPNSEEAEKTWRRCEVTQRREAEVGQDPGLSKFKRGHKADARDSRSMAPSPNSLLSIESQEYAY